MSQISKLITRLEFITQQMEDMISGDSPLAEKPKGYATVAVWHGPEVSRKASEKRKAEIRFQDLATEAQALAREAYGCLRSEGIDTYNADVEELNKSIFPNPSRAQVVRYAKVNIAALRAKSLLL
jgi:hypothetical protein